ncbi:MAG: alpha-ketoglutarate-dependent dioxygenase AlkB [Porticoccaceae bacterium]
MPDGELHYAPDFLPADIADQHLNDIIAATPWEQSSLHIAGREYLIPRLNAWYGDKATHYGYSGMRLDLNPWTAQLSALKQQVEAATGSAFNSALLNYYRSGSDSVDWHSDDERELGSRPVIAALSIGATRRFDLRHKTRKDLRYKLELQHGSLLVMAGAMQQHWAHRIAKTKDHCEARISITFRQVVT